MPRGFRANDLAANDGNTASEIRNLFLVLRRTFLATFENRGFSIAKAAAYSALLSFFPVLTSAISNGVNTTIQGTLNSNPSTVFTIEFFANAAYAAGRNTALIAVVDAVFVAWVIAVTIPVV